MGSALVETPQEIDIDLGDRSVYRYFNNHIVRFADLDPEGHVNNVAYAQYFESARVAFWRDAGRHLDWADIAGVIATMTMGFRAEMGFPGEIEIGTLVLGIGRSSTRMAQGLFRDGACMATSTAVAVQIDSTTRRPIPLSEELREAIMVLSEGR